ncbi:ABC transporter ATP-binding protein [Escherichia coli]|nr:ABC transporter ATP-binding protein [Escherichia coli]
MIKIENLTKSYRTPTGRHYVFKDLNIEIPSGKSVAFIGRNVTNLRMDWPVGLAGGFQGSLTGRENVKFVARLYAKQEELKEKIEFVEEFAELGKYFDMPIKTYSSGMRSRLGFGLSMAFKFDYYIVDEVTAVGDARFKEKCAQLFKERHKESSFLMVSHSLNSLKEFCDVAIVFMDDNAVSFHEDVQEGIEEYKNNITINTY